MCAVAMREIVDRASLDCRKGSAFVCTYTPQSNTSLPWSMGSPIDFGLRVCQGSKIKDSSTFKLPKVPTCYCKFRFGSARI